MTEQSEKAVNTAAASLYAEIERLRAERDEYCDTNETLLAYQSAQRKEVDRLRAQRDQLLAALKALASVDERGGWESRALDQAHAAIAKATRK